MQRRLPALLLAALGALLVARTAPAQTSYPMITSAYPVGCRRGTTTEVSLSGSGNLGGGYAVLFDGTGVQGEVVPPPAAEAGKPSDSAKLKVTVEPGAVVGPREFRLITPRGASTVGVLVIGDEPVVLEKEPNNTFAEATPIEPPAMLDGKLQSGEDVDSYRFQAAAGDEIVFACDSGRLQDRIHDLSPGGGGTHSDPVLTLTDAEGRELAQADDYRGPDPLLAFRFDKAGAYVIQIRDVRYSGHPTWTYCLTATRRPFVTAVYPMAGRPGETVNVQPVGFNLGAMQSAPVAVPKMEAGPMQLQIPSGSAMTNPVPFIVSDLPQFQESAKDDQFSEATPVELPGGWNGRIEADNDVDCFRFKGQKGKTYTFEVFARRYGSVLDPTIEVLDGAGKPIASNDDAVGKDSRLDWACPADGDYGLKIADLHNRGGPAFVYYVAATAARPDFALRCDDDKALVGPGSGYAMYVLLDRRNGFSGEVKLSVENLPPGVTATADRIPEGMSQGCVIFRATPDAKPEFRRVRISGAATIALPDGKSETVRRDATPLQEIYIPGGGRTPFPVATHVVSVTEPSDVLVKLSADHVTLQPGGSASVDVDIVRQKGYAKNVVLDVYLRHLGSIYGNPLPPGVSLDESASKTLLSEKETKGKIVLRAAPDAKPIENLPIAVLGQVSINFVVKVSHASEPLFLTVKK
jgi:hypothetical protein